MNTPLKEDVKEYVEIEASEYKRIEADLDFLEALRAAGVDNWEGYGYALDILNGDNV